MEKIALLIGVSTYPTGLNPLPAAIRDVEAVKMVLEDANVGGFDEVMVLKDCGLGEMQSTIATFFDDRQPDDLLLLYFSGHGITDEYGKFFFANCDTRKTAQGRLNKGTAVPAHFVHDVMEASDCDRQVVILDCCHSGAFPTGMIARDSGTIDLQAEFKSEVKGRIILTSSAATEYSFERQGEELAVYTSYLVDGIKTGAADRNNDGLISANELHDYVQEKVRKAAPAMKPERYVFRDGDEIIIARAAQSDPARRFRKEVEKRIRQGALSAIVRRTLETLRQELGLAETEAAAVINEVLRPYQELQQKIQAYDQCFREALNEEDPLSEFTRNDLKDYQQILKLTDENVAAIESRVLGDRPPVSSPVPATPQIATPPRDRPAFPPQLFTEDLGNGIQLAMLPIPGGDFLMGAAEQEAEATSAEYP
jgi:Caspase domain